MVKTSNFLKNKMSMLIKSYDLYSWNFSPLNNMGAANKVSGNKTTGIKVLKKIIPKKKTKKKVLNLVKMRSSLRRLHKKDFSSVHLHIEYSQGCF